MSGVHGRRHDMKRSEFSQLIHHLARDRLGKATSFPAGYMPGYHHTTLTSLLGLPPQVSSLKGSMDINLFLPRIWK